MKTLIPAVELAAGEVHAIAQAQLDKERIGSSMAALRQQARAQRRRDRRRFLTTISKRALN